jgi:TM2 domain-containing membrane protein YozV
MSSIPTDKFCQACGSGLIASAAVCPKCGTAAARGGYYSTPGTPVTEFGGQKDWLTALILSGLVGYLGVDRFYTGYIGLGILKLCLTLLCGIGLVWWLIDLIMIATGSFRDSQGQPLVRR